MTRIVLKRVADPANKGLLCIVTSGVFLALYFLSGTFHLGQAGLLPLFDIERNIPVVEGTIWIYVAVFPVIFKIIYEIECEQLFNKCFYAYYLLLIFSVFIFVIYPVSYPREYFPILPQNTLNYAMFNFIRKLDAPTNCFPSMHVSASFLFSFFIWHESKIRGFFYTLFSVAVAISTLTTKQHYLVDVIAGLVLAMVTYGIFYHFTDIKSQSAETQAQTE